MDSVIQSKYIKLSEINIHYLVAGKGETIFLIHGWPTSAYLWRHLIPELAKKFQVIAIDLPGFGSSDKKLTDSFSFRYYSTIINEFLEKLEINDMTLALHDIGGPIGLHWFVNNMHRVNRLIIFNTFVYSKFSWAVKLFGIATVTPIIKNWLTSRNGIKKAIYFGVNQKQKLTTAIIQNYQKPFKDKESRKVLLKTVQRLSLKGYDEIAQKLKLFHKPVQILYGERDKILPKVKETMQKIMIDLPQAQVISFPNCGHFLQEEEPKKIVLAIIDFMKIKN